jgi:CRP/FNR family transcriptional regulator
MGDEMHENSSGSSKEGAKESTAARRIALLKEVPLFAGLGEKQLSAVVQDLRSRDYKKDELLFRQGDESREIYIILKGKVRVYKISPSGNETSIDARPQPRPSAPSPC